MKTKRNLIQICLLGALFLPIVVQAQFTYTTNSDNTINITGYTGDITVYTGPSGALTFPPTLAGLPITSLGEGAFEDFADLTSVTIGNSISSIGESAFAGSSVTNATIGSSVTNIGYVAFGYTYLTAITVDAANPAYASAGGILFNKNLTTLVQYPGGLYGPYTIPSNITSIATGAFADCDLGTIAIPSSVISIGDGAFYTCSLTAITVGAANPAYSSAGGVLFNKSQTLLVQYPKFLSGPYTIPNSVSSIGYYSFAYCEELTSLTIGNSVTNIADGAFAYSGNSLTNVTFGNSVATIGELAFAGCWGLTNVTIPSSVESIGDEAFFDCINLKGLYFQGNAPSLGGTNVFQYDVATVYYAAGTTGWGATYGGLPAVLFFPNNLVINGDFETGDFTGWTLSSFGFNNTVVAYPHSGFYAAQFSKNGSGLDAVTMSQTLPTQPGQVYLLSLWVNGVSNGDGLVDWNGTTLVNESFAVGWTHLAYIVTATSTSTRLKFVTAGDITDLDDVSVVPLLNYDRLTARPLNGGAMQFSFQGNLNANYALDRTFNLLPPINWTPQSTNATDANGVLLLSNTPVSTTNNFWRIRSVP